MLNPTDYKIGEPTRASTELASVAHHHQCGMSDPLQVSVPTVVLMVSLTQEKLNEAIVVMNKTLQVRVYGGSELLGRLLTCPLGHQHPKHEHRAGRPDVQELPVQCVISFGG